MKYSHGETLFLKVEERNLLSLETLLASGLRDLVELQNKGVVCEVYIPPSASAVQRKNSWWSNKFLKVRAKQTQPSKAYQHYRETIDQLLIDCLKYHGKGKPLRIAELCSGDGSLATKILSVDGLNIKSYTLYEKNAKLIEQSILRTKEYQEKIKHHNIDVCSNQGEVVLSQLKPEVNIWLASGSVLCGQVGSFTMAESVLLSLTKSLKYGGHILITGFTQSFLHPALIEKSGLRVVQASVPSTETGELESGFGRFQMFVLLKSETPEKLPELKQKMLYK